MREVETTGSLEKWGLQLSRNRDNCNPHLEIPVVSTSRMIANFLFISYFSRRVFSHFLIAMREILISAVKTKSSRSREEGGSINLITSQRIESRIGFCWFLTYAVSDAKLLSSFPERPKPCHVTRCCWNRAALKNCFPFEGASGRSAEPTITTVYPSILPHKPTTVSEPTESIPSLMIFPSPD